MANKKVSSSIKHKRISVSHEKKVIAIYPMMPRGYNAAKRAKLRQFEKELLGESSRVFVE